MTPRDTSRGTTSVHLALLAVQLFFASFSPVGKIALREVPAVGLASIRVTLAAAVFVVLWLVAGRERIGRGDVARLALYSLFGVTANQLLFLAGLARTSATSAVVLGTSIPVFTAAAALLLGREQTTPLRLTGLGVALGGALALTGVAGIESGGRALAGDALILTNSLCYAIYLVISRDMLARLRPLTMMMMVFLFGALSVDGFMFVAGAAGLLSFDPLALLGALPRLRPATFAAVGYIVLFPTVGAYLLNALALRVVPASLVAVYIYVQPVIGALLAALLLGERPTRMTLAAAAAIFGGIWLVNLDARRRAQALLARR